MAASDGKWWHVADKEVAELLVDLGGSNPFGHIRGETGAGAFASATTVATAVARPPRPRVSNSPRPSVQPEITMAVQRQTESPRPHVTPGTPLLSHRSSTRAFTPRRPLSAPRPLSARSSAAQKVDGGITVFVYNMHSADTLRFYVCPELRLGPTELCTAQDPQQSRYAQEVSVDERRSCGSSDVSSSASFKNEIARALGIDVTAIRLMLRGFPLGCDENTLRCYGVAEGDTVHMRLRRTSLCGRSEVLLAGAAKKAVQDAEWEKDEMLGMRPYAMQSPSRRNRLSQRCSENGVALMPKWVSQEHPKLFAPVGIGFDRKGGATHCATPYEDFNQQGIWIPPVDHPNQRGLNQYGLQRVREGCHAGHGGA